MLAKMWRNWITHSLLVECKMVQPLLKTVWQVLKNKQTCHAVIKQGNNCTPKHLSQIRKDLDTKTLTWMFRAALFIISESWKESRCPSTAEQLVPWYIHTVEYFLLRNKKEWSIDAFLNVSPENYAWPKKKKKSSLEDYILYESIHSSLEMTKLEMMDRLIVAKLPWCLRE